jgi:ATP-binding cassette, subfamily B (MDR/TAP), member 1
VVAGSVITPCAGLDNKGGRFFALANQTANEGIGALRTVHSYNMQDKVVRIYSSMLEGPARRSKRNSLSSGLTFGLGQCIMFLFYGLAFWYGGRLIVKKELTGLDMLRVFFSLLLASMGMSQAQIMFPDVAKGKSAVARVFRGVPATCRVVKAGRLEQVHCGLEYLY